MDHSAHLHQISSQYPHSRSREALQRYFTASLKELYFAKGLITSAVTDVQHLVVSPSVRHLLCRHYDIHLTQKKRLEKIFHLTKTPLESKSCEAVNALIAQARKDLTGFSDDKTSWEIALILISRKVAHYKIGSYGAAAHLAMSLNKPEAATLLAITVQEEEEFMEGVVDHLTDDFLRPS